MEQLDDWCFLDTLLETPTELFIFYEFKPDPEFCRQCFDCYKSAYFQEGALLSTQQKCQRLLDHITIVDLVLHEIQQLKQNKKQPIKDVWEAVTYLQDMYANDTDKREPWFEIDIDGKRRRLHRGDFFPQINDLIRQSLETIFWRNLSLKKNGSSGYYLYQKK